MIIVLAMTESLQEATIQVPEIFIAKKNSELVDKPAPPGLKPSDSEWVNSRIQCTLEEGSSDIATVEKLLDTERHAIHMWKGISGCCEISSFHGLPFVAISLRAKLKLISWFAALLIAVSLMLYSLSAVSTKYTSGNIYTSTSRRFPKQLSFPAVTICNLNPIKISALLANNLSLLQADMFLTYARARDNTTVPISYFSAFVQQYDMMSRGNNMFYEDLGHNINDLMLTCTFDGKRCSVDNFTIRATSSGLCYTFDPNGDQTHYYSSKHGYRYGLIIKVNIEQYEYFSTQSVSAGLNLFIHDHDHFPYTGEHKKLLLLPGQSTLLSVTKTDYIRLSPPQGICSDHVTLTLFKSYTRESCLIECETQLTIKACGCKAEYMPGSEETCSLNQTVYCILPHAKSFQPELCDCPIPCSNVEYDGHLSYSKYPASHLGQVFNNSYFLQSGVVPVPSFAIANYTDANGTVISYLINRGSSSGGRDSYLKLAVYYDAMEYNIITEVLQYTSGRFIADFTGFIEFFIGVGFLSFFEVMELLYSFIKPPK